MADPVWSLHPRLTADTFQLGDLALSRVLLMADARYPWLLLVPRRLDAVEIIDLDDNAQAQLSGEITRVSRALKQITRCDKLNVAAIGNMVPQLHVHIIARSRKDVSWPSPVWGRGEAVPYQDAARDGFMALLRHGIGLE
ncbi:MAG: HIT domain-containing protein [Alphaproteobacteria bacterium]|nr:HIT domain-containing protein [Alphaproteobacteria bacterium]